MGGKFSDTISPGNIMHRLHEVERKLNELTTARILENAAIGSGGLRLFDGGNIEVDDGGDIIIRGGALELTSLDNETGIAFLGTTSAGARIWAFSFHNGDEAIRLAGTEEESVWVMKDRDGNNIITSSRAGTGLGRPFLSLPIPQPTGIGFWPSTTSGTFAAISRSEALAQHMAIGVSFSAFADAGTTGDVRFTVNGTQVGSSVNVSDGAFGSGSLLEELPPGINFQDALTLELEARRTAGGGEVYGICRSVFGAETT